MQLYAKNFLNPSILSNAYTKNTLLQNIKTLATFLKLQKSLRHFMEY